ncbi:hypothetical protein A3709_14360 [Halioglobus sp. HI00S01]|uniref:serine/threonine-protein kinase n=1 Tax=Halioglobus sp. HI00S01 TaxID=1822214 RepID=UPI0007C3EBEB|nr:serine/threonine-protein kinase [Halioglobus sp. HI00S01]KZX59473.1 hypothetical protein A3709_14360 [Halioglobus sp. HI00S01]
MNTTVGPYELVRLIASGGQGQVYLGYDARLCRQVAIKIRPLPEGRAMRRTVMREARLVASLNDERIVKIFDVIETPAHLALVMAYVPGTDLEHLLGHVSLSLASTLKLACDVAVALAAASQIGLVHGDIKASNVLVSEAGGICLADFGTAAIPSSPEAALAGGSLSALAPEHVLGEPVDLRTDLFALGRLLHRMLTGEHAFPMTLQAAERALAASRYELPALTEWESHSGHPPALAALVRRLLQAEPARRPQDTHLVRRELRTLRLECSLLSEPGLQAQAAPYFRPESATEEPLDIPDEFGQISGRRRAGMELRSLWRQRMPVSGAARAALALMLVGGMAGIMWWTRPAQSVIEVDLADIEISPSAVSVLRVTADDVLGLVSRELEQRLPGVRLLGAARPSVIYGDGDLPLPAAAKLSVQLRCGDDFCLLVMQRGLLPGEHRVQRLLVADAAPERWSDEIRQMVVAVYPAE